MSNRRASTRHPVRIAVLIAGAAALLLTGCGATAAKWTPTTTFVSNRYGYSIALPGRSGRWYSRPALANWTTGTIGGTDSPGFDVYTDLRSSRNYLLAAVPGTWNLSRWTDYAMSSRAEICDLPQSLPGSSLDAAQARIFTWTCSDGYRIVGLTALHAGRGYFVLVIAPISLSRASDLNALQAVQRSFRFTHA